MSESPYNVSCKLGGSTKNLPIRSPPFARAKEVATAVLIDVSDVVDAVSTHNYLVADTITAGGGVLL